MDNKLDLIALLDYINPSMLDYTEWVNVGMALKEEGYTAADWDEWSRNDNRYQQGECFKKWTTFQGSGGSPVTGATITQLAKENGWTPKRYNEESRELGWEEEIGGNDDLVIIDKNWVEGKEIKEPTHFNPVRELTKYLEVLFESTENVGYVTETWEKDGKYLPTKGASDRTAGQLIQELNQCDGDMGNVFGDYNPQAGAWIRFNPLDGKGVKNENVTDFRYALVESDTMDLAKQNAIIRELELPVACLVYSGKKSIHAIVRVDAADYGEYRKRVDYLYNICKKNGLNIDSQNRNPSRLSRMPGIIRGDKKQFIIDTNIGKENWEEWHEWIEGINDDLPETESLTEFWNDMPELAPVLIDGLLRQGHKMLMAGPSKAGKSFALIELCIALAEGRKWLGWNCKKGKVLYVNLELDRASCLHRFKDVYGGLGWEPDNLNNIDIWNLRGKTVPMDKLAPKLIRRATKKNYSAVIIDPIYKVLTGDENSADQMAHFTNQFDKICTELGSSVIYCHHHSKGGQGNKKSMDRASGSGVFARDPDALIDLVELEISDTIQAHQESKSICQVYELALKKYAPDYFKEYVSQDDLMSEFQMNQHITTAIKSKHDMEVVAIAANKAKQQAKIKTGWRVEGTLREFPKFEPVNMWFNYPVHSVDTTGILSDIKLDEQLPPWEKGKKARKENAKKEKKSKNQAFEYAINNCDAGNPPTKEEVASYLGVTAKTIERRLKDHGGFVIDKNNGRIVKKDEIKEEID
ncbi:AAA family ATPase [Carnobacterium divergens]|nr:AAA family ATPase [Carnobacterium divergens]MDT1955257.1 AAA family ATPase [Carnobacterium divergens]MDT1960495.1 AAA family ATPase [Carnobacterium divergens]MDT1963039.1 AAA family ATPase [Carnobacterium divergens]